MIIDRRLCVGQYLIGVLGYYTDAELMVDSGMNYIAMTLRKKHFNIKNSTPIVRMWSKPQYVAKQIQKQPKKREEILAKSARMTQKSIDDMNRWVQHSLIADEAWKEACDSFPETNAISTNQLIGAIFRKNPDIVSWYGFNQKKIDKILAGDKYIFASSRVATSLLKKLDETIARYNYNNKDK